MNKKQFSLAVLSIAVVALVIAFTFSFSAANNPASQKWEYLVVTPGKVICCGGELSIRRLCSWHR